MPRLPGIEVREAVDAVAAPGNLHINTENEDKEKEKDQRDRTRKSELLSGGHECATMPQPGRPLRTGKRRLEGQDHSQAASCRRIRCQGASAA